jgi:hypothetical protein
MQIELQPEMIDRLLALPENGMGYQIVDLVLVDGRIVPSVPVFNAEIARLPDDFSDITASDIADVRLALSARPRR